MSGHPRIFATSPTLTLTCELYPVEVRHLTDTSVMGESRSPASPVLSHTAYGSSDGTTARVQLLHSDLSPTGNSACAMPLRAMA